MNVTATLIMVFGSACAGASVLCIFRKRWALALLFALPALYVVVGGTIAVIKGQLIREARQKAMERGDIPWHKAPHE